MSVEQVIVAAYVSTFGRVPRPDEVEHRIRLYEEYMAEKSDRESMSDLNG